MKKLSILVLFNIGILNIYSQNFSIGVYSGYGTYNLSNIKQMQQQALSYYSPLQIKSVEKFPDYFNYLFTFEYKTINNYSWGLNLAHYSTAARNHLLDYSGEYKLDMHVNAYRLGLLFKRSYPLNEYLSFYYKIQSGFVFSNFKFNEKILVNNVDSVEYSYSQKSNAFFLEPTIGANYYIGHNFSIDVNIGYQADINSRFITKKDSYIYWSGFRFLVGVNYNLSSIFGKSNKVTN